MRYLFVVFSLFALFLPEARSDNFISVNPDSWGARMPKTPLPPIEPIDGGKKEPDANSGGAIESGGGSVMAVSKMEFWVQVGAFSDLANARGLAEKLKSSGYNSNVFPSDLNRVAIGPYLTKAQADRALDAIKSIAIDAFLTTQEKL